MWNFRGARRIVEMSNGIPRGKQTTISISKDTGEMFRRIAPGDHHESISGAADRIIAWWCTQPYPVRQYILHHGDNTEAREYFRETMASHLSMMAAEMMRRAKAASHNPEII